jgi:molecular chaperone HtpG
MSPAPESRAFQAEVKQLLDLVIHSLYSHKEVFLRELVSNASDALDKLRFEALTRPELQPDGELAITIEIDPAARTLTVSDNGIGMTRDEVLANIGTIARSGSKEFLATLRASAASGEAKAALPGLIGQFGVGFYASFMVADRVTLTTRRAGEATATRWESTGDGTYTIDSAQRESAGTTVVLHLRPADPEAGLEDYTQGAVIRRIVKRYSDFVAYPIHLRGEPVPEGGEPPAPAPINSRQAIWLRPKDEVSEEEYREFYKHIAHDWNDPLERIALSIEGTFEARALLYVPSQAPFDLNHRERAQRGIQLYVKRVFILDHCEDLAPPWLRFVRGVVDAEDLPLNVSREMLQQDRRIRSIRSRIVKRVLEALEAMQRDDRERYLQFWAQLGPVLKEGLLDFGADSEKLLRLVLAGSSARPGELATLAEYVGRMKPDQDAIYVLAGATREAAERSPHLEAFRAKGYEVLLFWDRVDDVWLDRPLEYEGKKIVAVGRGEVELGSEEERSAAREALEAKRSEVGDLLARLRDILQDEVSEVRLSSRLTQSPACLVSEMGVPSPQLEDALRRAGHALPKLKRIFELNPDHPILAKLRARFEADPASPELEDAAWVLYGECLLAEGGTLPDPARFGRGLVHLLERALA